MRFISIRVVFVVTCATSACGGDNGGNGGDDPIDSGSPDNGADGSNNPVDSGSPPSGEMVAIPAGSFMMGCNEAVEMFCNPDERPYHMVTLSAFEIDRTEVTHEKYAECVADSACPDLPNLDPQGKATFPINSIIYPVAQTYCEWAGKRLPTEAEWEYAARGTDGRKYPWGNEEPDCERANMTGCGNEPKPVGSHPTGLSPFGVADMAGNVSEWVADWYDAAYYEASVTTDPAGPGTGTMRIFRGGSFAGGANVLRVATREELDPETNTVYSGFRCAR